MAHNHVHETTIACPTLVEDGNKCADEVIIEWETVISVFETGKRICYMCDKYEDEIDPTKPCAMDNSVEEWTAEEMKTMTHQWAMESDEREDLLLVSYKTWCWHPMTKEQATEMLNDEWAAGAERAAESRY